METIKESLLKDVKNSGKGGFFYYYESSRDESAINVMHGSNACASLRNCYYSYMLGEKSLFEQFLPGIIRLCEKAIELKIEVSWRPSHVCLIYEAYAGATWLYTGQDNIDIWKECLAQTNLWFFEQRNPIDYSVCKGLDRQLFYTYLQYCLFAKEYQQGIAVYEHFKGNKPVKLTSKTGLVTLMYAILRHFAYGEFDKEKLNKTCMQVLGKELKHVYMKGRPDDAVYWLKTMCLLREKQYMPEEVVLTFYEFLEDEEIPDEIHKFLKERELSTRSDLIANGEHSKPCIR